MRDPSLLRQSYGLKDGGETHSLEPTQCRDETRTKGRDNLPPP